MKRKIKGLKLPTPEEMADYVGDKYAEVKQNKKALEEEEEALKRQAVRLAEEHGEERGNSRLLFGHRNKVGYTTPEAKATLNYQSLLEDPRFPAKHLNACSRVMRVAQPESMDALIKAGVIPTSLVRKHVVKGKDLTPRTLISPLTKDDIQEKKGI